MALPFFAPLVYLFCRETRDPRNDLSVRFFFEAHGVREDPATGNGTAFLGAYLRAHGAAHRAAHRAALTPRGSVDCPGRRRKVVSGVTKEARVLETTRKDGELAAARGPGR